VIVSVLSLAEELQIEEKWLSDIIPLLASLTVLMAWLRILQLLGVISVSGIFISIINKMIVDCCQVLNGLFNLLDCILIWLSCTDSPS